MKYFLETADTIAPGLGFPLFGAVHLCWLAVAAIFICLMAVCYGKKDPVTRARWRKYLAAAILLDEVWKMVWLTVGETYTLEYLPLHLCSINIFLIAIHAWRPSDTLDNFLYGVCIPGALAALLFPGWQSLPVLNFMHLHSFTIHAMLVAYPVMLTAAGDIRPELRKFPKCLVLTLCMAAPIWLFNRAFGTNYMFLMYAEQGNPLLLFEQWFGSHLWGFPVLGSIFVGAMYGILYLCRRLCRSRAKAS